MAGFDLHAHCARCRNKLKGDDPCVSKKPCPHCDVLSEDQKAQLSVPVYQKKKEKREQKNMDKNSDNSTETLVDPALVSVVGVVPSDKKSVKSPEPAINKEKSKKKHSTPSKKASTDEKLEAMDQRWSERFSRLEAFFVSKSLEGSHPTFQTIKMPTKTPPASAVKGSDPFLQPQASDHTAGRSGLATDQTCVPKNDRLQSSDIQQPTNRTLSDLSPTAPHQVPGPSGWQSGQNSDNDMDTDSDGALSHHQTEHIIEDEEFSDPDNDIPNADTDQALSEEQSYRETVRGIRSFMGWNHVPDIDNTSSATDDNPFATSTQQPSGRVSVKLPTDEWLCKKMDKLNVTLVEGYPSRASEAGGLQKDQFVKVGRSQSKWYGLHPNQEKSVESVTFWSSEPAKLNSSYSRVARSSGLSTPAPASRPISQDTLRRWERSAWESTYICNQAAGFSRCLSKVQSSMQTQLKLIQMEQSKGKSSERTGTATDELQYLLKFNSSITKCMAKTMEHLSEFVFINVANMTLARRDAYLAHVKVGIKHDTLSALRQAPIQLDKLFPEQMLKKAEEDIAQHENKNRPSQSSTGFRKDRFHLYQRNDKTRDQKSGKPAWKTIGGFQQKKKGKNSNFSSRPAKGQSYYK